MHHWRAGEEMSDHRPPVGEIARLLEGHGVVFQRLPPDHQHERIGLLDPAPQFQAVAAFRLFDELPPTREGFEELLGLSGMDCEDGGFQDHAGFSSHFRYLSSRLSSAENRAHPAIR
jgi:hypothetical protein